MKKTIHFDSFERSGWPLPAEIERFFLAPKGQEWSYQGGNDHWGISIDGLSGTDALPEQERVNAALSMLGHPDLGVFLGYSKWDGRSRTKFSYYSKGDCTQFGKFVMSLQGDMWPVALFVPFPLAWPPVRDFMATDGELPASAEWIASRDLPPGTFPEVGTGY